MIESVASGSPAATAGLTEGDTIMSCAGHPVSSPTDLVKILQGEKPGASVSLVYLSTSGALAHRHSTFDVRAFSVDDQEGKRPLPRASCPDAQCGKSREAGNALTGQAHCNASVAASGGLVDFMARAGLLDPRSTIRVRHFQPL